MELGLYVQKGIDQEGNLYRYRGGLCLTPNVYNNYNAWKYKRVKYYNLIYENIYRLTLKS